MDNLVSGPTTRKRRHHITDVEKRKIEQLVIRGFSVVEISKQVGLSTSSVSRVRKKMAVDSDFKEVKIIDKREFNEQSISIVEIGGVKVHITDTKLLLSIVSSLVSDVV